MSPDRVEIIDIHWVALVFQPIISVSTLNCVFDLTGVVALRNKNALAPRERYPKFYRILLSQFSLCQIRWPSICVCGSARNIIYWHQKYCDSNIQWIFSYFLVRWESIFIFLTIHFWRYDIQIWNRRVEWNDCRNGQSAQSTKFTEDLYYIGRKDTTTGEKKKEKNSVNLSANRFKWISPSQRQPFCNISNWNMQILKHF